MLNFVGCVGETNENEKEMNGFFQSLIVHMCVGVGKGRE